MASLCDGYTARDIACVASRIMHACLTRVTDTDDSTPRIITDDDVDTALSDFTPVSLRGVKLFKSNVMWDHVGGLVAAKRVLKETLEFPLRFVVLCLSVYFVVIIPPILVSVTTACAKRTGTAASVERR